jgi:hypothetical protein
MPCGYHRERNRVLDAVAGCAAPWTGNHTNEGATMKVFLAGGSGYIGRATIAELRWQGHTVEALARSERAEEAPTCTPAAAGSTATPGSESYEKLQMLSVIGVSVR